jgi:predicted N-formylglutamate amidohydrolase
MNARGSLTENQLLAKGDPAPVIAQNEGGASPHLLICDHAGRAIPRRLGGLGLGDEALEQHVAWDIGAGEVASRLGARLDAMVLRQAYSRLVVDCNRPLAEPSLIAEVSDGMAIPGNRALSQAERAARIAAIYAPYHAAIDAAIDARLALGRPVSVVSVHSFTPQMDSVARPWMLGVVHGGDSPLSARVLELLRREDGLIVGDNQPYRLSPTDCSIPRHAQARGVDYLELEIRQDLIEHEHGQDWAAELLARVITGAGA